MSKTFFCDDCPYKTVYKTTLMRHIQTKHSPFDPNLHKCAKCGKSFRQKSSLQRHSKICGPNKKVKYFYCDLCDYKSNRESNLTAHVENVHFSLDPNENTCMKCKKSYWHKSSLTAHSKICGLSNEVKSSLKYYACDNCDYKSMLKADLAKHMIVRHLPRDTNLNQCSKCKKCYSTRLNLNRHLKTCGSSKVSKNFLKCEYGKCKFKIDTKLGMAEHVQARHLPRDPNINKCDKCGKSYSQRSYFNRHYKICGQSEEAKRSMMRYSCDNCQFKANNKWNLTKHIRSCYKLVFKHEISSSLFRKPKEFFAA